MIFNQLKTAIGQTEDGQTGYGGLNFTPLRLNVFTMRIYILFTFLAFKTFAQEPHVSSGRLERINSFASTYVDARNIDIWLPDGYSPEKKYAVLYMHDGQMLYDSTTTWNKLTWDVDDVAAVLIKEKKVKDFIVVGIWNAGPKRHVEYFPQKPFESLPQSVQDTLYTANRSGGASVFNNSKVQSDNYLQFIVRELKPYVDKKYATKKDRANTIIAGSSMGGLISMYAICEYPEVFGGAACLSTHWPPVYQRIGRVYLSWTITLCRKHFSNTLPQTCLIRKHINCILIMAQPHLTPCIRHYKKKQMLLLRPGAMMILTG